jgi:hypothetical protein
MAVLKVPQVTTSMKKLIIIKAGSTFPATRQRLGDFEDWIIRAIGSSDIAITVVDVLEGEALPPVDMLAKLFGVPVRLINHFGVNSC